MRRPVLIFAFLVLAAASCVKEADWNPDPAGVPVLVVDGIITDVQGEQVIRLSWSVNDLNETPAPVSEASLLIYNEDSTWKLTEQPPYSGRYLTPSAFVALPGKNYTLSISHNGTIYSAKSAMLSGRFFDPAVCVQDETDSLFRIDWVASAFSTDEAAMWEVILDWSGVPGYEGEAPEATSARLLFYTLPTLDVSQLFAPAVEKIRFPAGTILTENRYSLTPEHAEFIRELLMETGWQGGLFSSFPANVSTNVSNGAIGWFGACGKTSLSFIVTP